MDHCDVYYRRADGSPTGEKSNIVHAVRPLIALYSDLPVGEFGVEQLEMVRESMIRANLGSDRGAGGPGLSQALAVLWTACLEIPTYPPFFTT